jgi:hypothetical protein
MHVIAFLVENSEMLFTCSPACEKTQLGWQIPIKELRGIHKNHRSSPLQKVKTRTQKYFREGS